MIHAAWYTDHADYLVADVNRAWRDASGRLIDAFRASGGGKIVGLGTCVEYAPDGGACRECDTPLEPDTLYGACKRTLSEHLLAMPGTASARIFFIYGHGDRGGRLVPHLLDQARAGRAVSVRFGGLRRDYTHIDDLAAMIVALADSDVTGAVNTGSGGAVPLADLASSVAEAADRPDLSEPNDRVDPAQAPAIKADMARYRDTVGPVPSRSLVEGLRPLI